MKSHLPEDSTCISELLQSALARQAFSGPYDAQILFDRRPPCDEDDLSIVISFPGARKTSELREMYNKHTNRDEMKSVSIVKAEKSTLLPLRALGVWAEMIWIQEGHNLWEKAKDWVDCSLDRIDDSELLANVDYCFDTVGWNEVQRAPGSGFPTTMVDLVCLLGDSWITNTVLDKMLALLSIRSIEFGYKHFLIAPVTFYNCLSTAYQSRQLDITKVPLLLRYTEALNNGTKILYFPAHIDNNHWVPFRIDICNRDITYGDSLDTSKNSKVTITKAAMWWAKTCLNISLTDSGNTLVHARQNDSHSCGLITVNTIGHDAVGEELWNDECGRRYRIVQFVNIVKAHIKASPSTNDGPNDIPSYLRYQLQDVNFLDIFDWYKKESSLQHQVTPRLSNASYSPVAVEQLDLSSEESTRHLSLSDAQTNVVRSPITDVEEHCSNSTSKKFSGAVDELKKRKADAEMDGLEPKTKRATLLTDFFARKVKEEGCDVASLCGKVDEETEVKTKEKITERTVSYKTDNKSKSTPHQNIPGARQSLISTSFSTALARYFRDDARSRALDGVDDRLRRFRKMILEFDPFAFFSDDIKNVGHSKCVRIVRMHRDYNTTRFRAHVRDCRSKGSAIPVHHFFSNNANRNVTLTACPGITIDIEPLVSQYLRRTGATGGGSSSVTKIAASLYREKYVNLEDDEKKEVINRQYQGRRWINDHAGMRVYASNCLHFLPSHSTNALCLECKEVLNLKLFRNALRRIEPKEDNYRYLNKAYRPECLGFVFAKTKGLSQLLKESAEDSQVPLAVKFVQGILKGQYKDKHVFWGLLDGMVKLADRESRNKGRQNFQYNVAWDQFAQELTIRSPAAAKIILKYLPIRTARSSIAQRTKMGRRFFLDLSDDSIEEAVQALEKLGYMGKPITLSADDTKLLPAIKPFLDTENDKWYFVGDAKGPIPVSDSTGSIKDGLRSIEFTPATKLRLYSLLVPLPNVPPIVLAALPILDTVRAETLADQAKTIIKRLAQRNIWVASYCCDGAEKERAAQRLLCKGADSTKKYIIKTPNPSNARVRLRDITFEVPMYNNHPVVLLQDSKHALKTFRNNLCSGARLLVLGNGVAMYEQVRQAGIAEDGPLFRRDVDKSDRQDDCAAQRYTSAAMLEWLAGQKCDNIGVIVYLFVFGELVDAYQNRKISHLDRLKLVLRAQYFLQSWKMFLHQAGYPLAKYFISREADDICNYLIHGFISLIYLYRGRSGVDVTYPLLPWLHSTETIEHTFGECRKLVSDFNYCDFIYMNHNAQTLTRLQMENQDLQNPRSRAGGYLHSWFDCRDADLYLLSQYPCDEEIQQVAIEAFLEHERLCIMLGINHVDFVSDVTKNSGLVQHLPSIQSWFDEEVEEVVIVDDQELVEDKFKELEEVIEVRKILEKAKSRVGNGQTLALASMLLDFEESYPVQVVDETDEELDARVEQIFNDAREAIDDALFISQFPKGKITVKMSDKEYQVNRVTDIPPNAACKLNLQSLIEYRRQHQTALAQKSVRLSRKEREERPIIQTRREVLKTLQDLLSDPEKGVGTGLDRKARWNSASLATGNTANAAIAAGKKADEVLTRRRDVFKRFPLRDLVDGGLSDTPLKTGSYAFLCLDESSIVIGKVLTIYSKTGGNYGMHAWKPSITNIASVSHLAVQIFDHLHGQTFRARTVQHLHVNKVAIIPSRFFLLAISPPHMFYPDKRSFDIEHIDNEKWDLLHACRERVAEAVASLRKRWAHT